MFRIVDRWLRHKAAMDITRLAVDLTSDAIFRGEEKDITKHVQQIADTAEQLATAHVAVCNKLGGIVTSEPNDSEVKALTKIFNRNSST